MAAGAPRHQQEVPVAGSLGWAWLAVGSGWASLMFGSEVFSESPELNN